jgi:hypothetical protein
MMRMPVGDLRRIMEFYSMTPPKGLRSRSGEDKERFIRNLMSRVDTSHLDQIRDYERRKEMNKRPHKRTRQRRRQKKRKSS